MAKRTQPYRFGVPAKYLAGLSDAAARKRAAEIKRTAKAYKAGKRINTKKVQKSRMADKRKKKK
tara:strand:+ start:202 stop:393 length:192 start_codon:yes stop_codon:yes gene_type:complete